MSKHQLFRLAQSIWNKPHLITAEAFDVILSYIDSRNGVTSLMAPIDMPEEPDDDPDDLDDLYELGIAVINVSGSLTYKPVMTMCGEVGTSYQELVEQFEDAIEAGCKTIVMNIESGGGEASHCFQTAEDIRSMCDEAGVYVYGYADTMACSAAYALGVICDELHCNPSATLGSIGCVVCLCDTSKAMEQAGLRRIFITSGSNKVPFNEAGEFKQEFLDSLQEEVNRVNDEFASHVSKYSGLSVDEIKALEAESFNANDAVEKGLANSVMTNKEFVKYVVTNMEASND